MPGVGIHARHFSEHFPFFEKAKKVLDKPIPRRYNKRVLFEPPV